jgi:hypothetical protein
MERNGLHEVFLRDKIAELETISKEIMGLSVHGFLFKDDGGEEFKIPNSVNNLLNKQNLEASKLNTRILHVISDLTILKNNL